MPPEANITWPVPVMRVSREAAVLNTPWVGMASPLHAHSSTCVGVGESLDDHQMVSHKWLGGRFTPPTGTTILLASCMRVL